ncbi:hypothetical protein [Conexibacter woesei]|uniref:Uncharacterized protein n=1 Tax=Conexibacter woesei (strain DSM 14684 / CCUG 47730 / CIP 108061 / JCM 11494 / NBRC 100937 / ID131577) TaxID=469383 RepID=D3F1B3_CONWI|nr:hypothetical protein [Conexibacter woesei]ADB52076.1 hypothetical protein Cwoe_3659 [Conexibacter woesei DSM 14684]
MSEQREAQQANHQTIRLSKGKHAAPTEGACVMELASMLAGEPFSDRPASACPVIGGFLRAYNDRVDEDRRQDLYRYAAEVVGTRGTAEVERARESRCLEWAEERRRERSRPLRWIARSSPPLVDRRLGLDAAGTYAARSIRRHTDRSHAAALALIDELITMGHVSVVTASPEAAADGTATTV